MPRLPPGTHCESQFLRRAIDRLLFTVPPGIRQCICFEYENFGLHGKYRKGLLWTDSSQNEVSWQCADTVTPWHGEIQYHPDRMVVHFDAKMLERLPRIYDDDGIPIIVPEPKSAVVMPALDGSWLGHDYQSRMVKMTPLTKWICKDFSERSPEETFEYWAKWEMGTLSWKPVAEDQTTIPDGYNFVENTTLGEF